MPRIRRIAAWSALCAALACARSPAATGPVPLSVVPGQGTGDAALAVEIQGQNLDAWVRSDFASASAGTVDARYTAALDPVSGGTAVALQDVTLTPRRTLQGTIPAGVAHGVYRLRIADPRGRTGVLEDAFRVVTPTEAVAAFRVDLLETPRAGVPFPVSLVAVDPQGNAVDGFDGAVSLAVSSGSLSPASAGPFAKGTLLVRVTIPDLAVRAQLTVSDALARTGASPPFDVVAGPPTAVVFAQQPVTAAAGTCSPAVALELRDVLGHPATAEGDVTASLQSAPPEVRFFSDAACTAAVTSVTIRTGAPGASFHFLAPAAGTITLRALPATLPSAAQDETVSP